MACLESGIVELSTEKTEGFVIRMADFSESSRVVTFFTRDFGKVAMVAKGAKRLKSAFEAALDLLTVCNIVFIRKSSSALDILTEAQLKFRFKAKEKDLNSVYAAYYAAELLAGLTEEYDPHRELYDEAVLALNRFAEGDKLFPALMRFELIMLRETGHLPMFDCCLVCGTPLASNGSLGYKDGQGGVICAECEGEEPPTRRIQGGTLAILNCLLSDLEHVWNRVVISPQQLRELRSILNPAISEALGRRPQMLNYLKFSP